jgi:U3 small nucleolar RNA-associated protein 14
MASTDSNQDLPSKQQSNPWLSSPRASPTTGSNPDDNPWLSQRSKKHSKQSNSDNRIDKIQNKRKRTDQDSDDARLNIDVSIDAINEKLKANLQHLSAENDGEDGDVPTMTYGRGRIAFQQQELINRAFAADGFEQDFAAEKEAAIAEDAPKEEDLTLPGWGSWMGLGVKRRATEKKLIKKVPGIEASSRKDAKLKNVIINEKRVKNVYRRDFRGVANQQNSKYLAGAVPYPFETREQYERSLSMSVGPEWTTREMYQKMTKPRVTIRAGAVVNPLQAPFK